MSGRQLSFFTFPAEIRIEIYRLLLVHSEGIGSQALGVSLCPAILSTCRQILSEARPILYGENVWGMTVADIDGYREAFECGTDMASFLFHWSFLSPPRILDLRKFWVRLFANVNGLETITESINVRSLAAKVFSALSRHPHIDYLMIQVGFCDLDGRGQCYVLTDLADLPHPSKVDFTFVPPVLADYMRHRLTGAPLTNPLPMMYEMLETWATNFGVSPSYLRECCIAMGDGDAHLFKLIRRRIVNDVITKNPVRRTDMDHILYQSG
ncbi:hypothetical protein B0T24DRAFT_639509 [Lasiosphaeria ovina]|uniref:F-box domain-containing protein n=1 Tax=Lasiosphaeria ovina TaxID=92902 RepID=A0AAE0JVI3_9PEZI|nr:hypothetical protein B0T24DRAFT_639509 [Lasiosphaeria ovina]